MHFNDYGYRNQATIARMKFQRGVTAREFVTVPESERDFLKGVLSFLEARTATYNYWAGPTSKRENQTEIQVRFKHECEECDMAIDQFFENNKLVLSVGVG